MELLKPKLHPHDKLMKYSVLLLIPSFLRPNHFTYLRFVFTPLVIYFILNSDYRSALVAFLLVSFTDAIDGSMARTRDQITERGTILDPIADKILISSTVFVLMLKHINVFISLAIIVLESLFLIGWYLRRKYGKKDRVNVWGKIKMVLQVVGVAILLLGLCTGNPMMFYYSQGTLVFAIIFAIISLFSYGL